MRIIFHKATYPVEWMSLVAFPQQTRNLQAASVKHDPGDPLLSPHTLGMGAMGKVKCTA